MGAKCCICIKDNKKDKDSLKNDSKSTKATKAPEEKGPLNPNDINPEVMDFKPQKLYNPQSSLQSEQFKMSLKTAIEKSDLDEIINIIRAGFPVNHAVSHEKFTALHLACKLGKTEVVKILLEKIQGTDINYQEETEKWTPLMVACMNGHIEIVKILLQNKADITLVSEENKTAAIYAEQGGFKEIKKLLKK